jgi:excisionase family DNA binding protein
MLNTLLNCPRLLTTHQVARRLNVSEETVRRRLRQGEIPGLRLGSGPRAPFRVVEAELEQWLYGDPEEAA